MPDFDFSMPGVEILKEPHTSVKETGLMALPSYCDRDKFAYRWVEQGHVDAYKERQQLVGISATADGWTPVFKPGTQVPEIRASKNEKKYVLVCRKRETQDSVTKLYAKLSKDRAMNRLEGFSVGNKTAEQARAEDGLVREAGDMGQIMFNENERD